VIPSVSAGEQYSTSTARVHWYVILSSLRRFETLLRNCESHHLLRRVRPSVCPQETNRLPTGISMKFVI